MKMTPQNDPDRNSRGMTQRLDGQLSEGLSSVLGPATLRPVIVDLARAVFGTQKIAGMQPHYVIATQHLQGVALSQSTMPTSVARDFEMLEGHLQALSVPGRRTLVGGEQDPHHIEKLLAPIRDIASDARHALLIPELARPGNLPGEIWVCPYRLAELMLVAPDQLSVKRSNMEQAMGQAYVYSGLRHDLEDAALFFQVGATHQDFPRLEPIRRYLTKLLGREVETDISDEVAEVLAESIFQLGWKATCEIIVRNIDDGIERGACNLLRGLPGWHKKLSIKGFGCGGNEWIEEL